MKGGCHLERRIALYKSDQRESRRDQEEGDELDSHEEIRHFYGSRRDQDSNEEVRHFYGSRRDQEEGGGAGPSREPRADQEQGDGFGLRKLDNLLLQLFLNSCATDIVLVILLRTAVETAIAEYTSCRTLPRSGLDLTQLLFWWWSTASSVFRVEVHGRATHCFSPLPPIFPVPNKPSRFCCGSGQFHSM